MRWLLDLQPGAGEYNVIGDKIVTKHEIFEDVKQTLGMVPDWLKCVPDHVLEHEWSIMKTFQLGQTTIPNKYKELIGLAVASQMQCPYCTHFHTEAAKLWGATEEEIHETLEMAKHTAGWSTFIAGTQYDLAKFKQETATIIQHAKRQGMAKPKAA